MCSVKWRSTGLSKYVSYSQDSIVLAHSHPFVIICIISVNYCFSKCKLKTINSTDAEKIYMVKYELIRNTLDVANKTSVKH